MLDDEKKTLAAAATPSLLRRVSCHVKDPGEYLVVCYAIGHDAPERDDAADAAWPSAADAPRLLRAAIAEIFERFDASATGRWNDDDLRRFSTEVDATPAVATESQLRAWLLVRGDLPVIMRRLGYEPRSPKSPPRLVATHQPLAFSIHSDDTNLAIRDHDEDHDEDLFRLARTLPVLATGVRQAPIDEDRVQLYVSETEAGLSFLAANTADTAVEITLDASASTNCRALSCPSFAAAQSVTRRLEPAENSILLDLAPAGQTPASWQWTLTLAAAHSS